MRSFLKTLALGVALVACAAANQNANAQTLPPLRASGTLYNSSNPGLTFAYYAVNLKAGDPITVKFKGPSHFQVRIYDRLSGKPMVDRNGLSVKWQYNGALNTSPWTAYSTWYTMNLTMPVNAPDAIMVVKNPEAASGGISYQVYCNPTLVYVPTPTPLVLRPTFQKVGTALDTKIQMNYQVSNGASLPIPVTTVQMYDNTRLTFQSLFTAPQSVGYIPAHSTSATKSVKFDTTVTRISLAVSSTVYGETKTTSFTFLTQ